MRAENYLSAVDDLKEALLCSTEQNSRDALELELSEAERTLERFRNRKQTHYEVLGKSVPKPSVPNSMHKLTTLDRRSTLLSASGYQEGLPASESQISSRQSLFSSDRYEVYDTWTDRTL